MTIGAVIKILRASAGLSQQELAARVGVSASFLSLLERDKREPTVRVLRGIGNTLGIPPGVLVAAALQSDQAAETPEGAKVVESLNHLIRAAHHYVLSERLNRAVESPMVEDQQTRRDSASDDAADAPHDSGNSA